MGSMLSFPANAVGSERSALNLAIDPTLFERFGIQQVPALVVDDDKAFDVIYGHLTIEEGLSRIAGHGDTRFTLQDARRISDK